MTCKFHGYLHHYGFKYISRIIWCACTGVLFWRTYEYYRYGLENVYLYSMLGDSLCFARASAAVLNLNCAIILLPMCHTLAVKFNQLLRKINICFPWIRWDATAFHIFFGYLIFIFTCVHIVSHTLNMWKFYIFRTIAVPGLHPFPDDDRCVTKILFTTVTGLSGLALVLVISVMLLTTIRCLRRRFYNLFLYSHRLFFIFYALLLVHGMWGPLRRQTNTDQHTPGCNNSVTKEFWKEVEQRHHVTKTLNVTCEKVPTFSTITSTAWLWLIGPLALYFLDVLFRLRRRSQKVEALSSIKVTKDIREVSFQVTNFKAYPGQYILLHCHKASSLEWHPFTIVQVPLKTNNGELKVMINRSGDWTDKFHNISSDCEKGESDICAKRHTFHIDGPYASPMERMRTFEVVLLVAGGVGITPFLAQVNYLLQKESISTVQKKSHINLVLSSRDQRLLEYCNDACDETAKEKLRQKGHELHVQLYLTSAKSIDDTGIGNPGRPNFEEIFSKVKLQHKGSTIGAFVCGPPALCDSVKKNCLKYSGHKTKFVFHKESF